MKYIDLQNYLMKKLRRHISQAEIAKIIGLDKSSISLYIKKDSDLKTTHKEKLEEWFGFQINDNENIVNADEFINAKSYTDIMGSCGNGVFEQSQNYEIVKIPKYLIENYSSNKEYSIITARGDSMAGSIEDGDKLLIESFDGQQITDNKIYAFCYDTEIFVKRLLKNINQIIIKSDNENYPPRYIEGDDLDNINIIGRVIAQIRN